jgi:hypothetical protein
MVLQRIPGFDYKKGMEGLQQISQMMVDLRENPLKKSMDNVIMVEDYQTCC